MQVGVDVLILRGEGVNFKYEITPLPPVWGVERVWIGSKSELKPWYFYIEWINLKVDPAFNIRKLQIKYESMDWLLSLTEKKVFSNL